MSILNELPKKSDISGSIDLNISLGLDNLSENMNVDGLSAMIRENIPTDLLSAIEFPQIPESFSIDSLMGNLNSPLNNIKSVNLSSITGGIPTGKDLFNLDIPSFDINSIIGDITAVALPFTISFTDALSNIEGLEDNDLLKQVDKIINASASIPFKLLNMLINLYKSFINILTDPEKLMKIAGESVQDIYINLIQNLLNSNPLYSLKNINKLLIEDNFLRDYKKLLIELQIVDISDSEKVTKLISLMKRNIKPVMKDLKQMDKSIEEFYNNNVDLLNKSISDLLNFMESDEVLFSKFFDKINSGFQQFVDKIRIPFDALSNITDSIKEYLNIAAEKTEGAANTIAGHIDTNMGVLNSNIGKIETFIEDVDTKVSDFISSINTDLTITPVKKACNTVGEKLEEFFTKIEELKIKLNSGLAFADKKIDEEYNEKLEIIQGKIKEFLGHITGIINREEVREVIDKVDEGLDNFKEIIEDVSMEPAFDLVVSKSKDVEDKIKKVDISKMGPPHKMALKTLSQVAKAVSIDSIVKPYIMDGFNRIQTPVLEFISFIKEKYNEFDSIINNFAPGTIVSDLVKNSEPFKLIIDTLNSVRPSMLLEPLKEVYEILVKVVEELDPDIIINPFQEIFDSIVQVIDVVSPEKINRIVDTPLNIGIKELEKVYNNSIPDIIDSVKDIISLDKLLDGTGIKEITDIEIWKNITYYLGGKFLDDIKLSITDFVGEIDMSPTLDKSSEIEEYLILLSQSIDETLSAKGSTIKAEIDIFDSNFENINRELNEIKTIWSKLLEKYSDSKEFKLIYDYIKPDIFTTLFDRINSFKLLDENELNLRLFDFKNVLEDNSSDLQAISVNNIQEAFPVIVRNQFINPIFFIIDNLKTVFEPISGSILSIEEVVETLLGLPAKIDEATSIVLDSIESNVKETILAIINGIKAFKEALNDNITLIYEKLKSLTNNINPYWVLNSFTKEDFIKKRKTEKVPAGFKTLIDKIITPEDNIFSALIKSFLTDDQILILNEKKEESLTLFVDILNSLITKKEMCPADIFDHTKQILTETAEEVKATLEDIIQSKSGGNFTVADKKKILENINKQNKLDALIKELFEAKVLYEDTGKEYALIRLNRVILESNYIDHIMLSMQSIFSYMVEQIAGVYPQEAIDKIDEIYFKIVDKVEELPDQLIRVPLEEEYNKLKALYNEVFSFKEIIETFEEKMSGFDEELSEGFDRLGGAYKGMLTAIESRMS